MKSIKINFPKTIKVGGFVCKVITGHVFDASEPPIMGKYEPNGREILLPDTVVNDEGRTIVLDVATKWSTFFHELHHAMGGLLGNTLGRGRFTGETLDDAIERIVDTYAEAWLTILRDNPDLRRAIGGMAADFKREAAQVEKG